jgi:hypothetical protein
MHAGADNAAGRAAGLGGSFDADPALPEGQNLGSSRFVVNVLP